MNNGFIWIPDSIYVRYSNSKVTWLGRPFEYRTFWTINRPFQSSFHPQFEYPTIWQPDTNLPLEYQTSPVIRWLMYSYSDAQYSNGIWWSDNFWLVGIRKLTLWNPDSFKIQTFSRSVSKWSGFWRVGTIWSQTSFEIQTIQRRDKMTANSQRVISQKCQLV